ncbi:P-loop containing nucleoside triphosphate hydrolase protein [Dipodascopsis uninucleata]
MENTYTELAIYALNLLRKAPADKRIIIAVSGMPGSGKSSLAQGVCKKIEEISIANGEISAAAYLPMDGFHYTRKHLAEMPNSAEAFARRGAPFTFDAPGLLALIEKLRATLIHDAKPIYAPSFDHAVKDPIESDIEILPTDRIIITEGNYLHLKEDPWCRIAALMDELWFICVDRDIARERIIKRHLQAGIAQDYQEAVKRADENDLVNGDYIIKNSMTPHKYIYSIPGMFIIKQYT